MNNIRNFSIIAHIDHGKSTLADRMLETTCTIEKRKMKEQVLDSMDLERERGITIKMQPVRMVYHLDRRNDADSTPKIARNSASFASVRRDSAQIENYVLNLIDTPGHIDFSYEVSRALRAVEGCLLLVDATQGVQAQTLTTLSMASDLGLVIIPVLSKVDSPLARIEEVKGEIVNLLSCKREDIIETSGKTGQGVAVLLSEIVKRIPPPKKEFSDSNSFRALVFDFAYSTHKGIIVYLRVMNGEARKGQSLMFRGAKKKFSSLEVGVFAPEEKSVDSLSEGAIGYIVTGIKEAGFASVGDTLSDEKDTHIPFSGYTQPSPVVWASMYPESQDDFTLLKQSLGRLKLSDASFSYEEESSGALGRGFRCGFLGMLHLEIITERLRREFKISLIVTTPSITYTVELRNGKTLTVYSPAFFPESGEIIKIWEPWVEVKIISPSVYIGEVMQVLFEHEAQVEHSETWGDERTSLEVKMPLRELMRNFFDQIKSVSSGFASLSYTIIGNKEADVARLDVLVAEEIVPAFSRVVSKRIVEEEAKKAVEKLARVLPKQLFTTKIQAVAMGRIISSHTLSALKKDVTGHLYGGDITRKKKLWEKQKKGKKKMLARGKVSIPQEVFLKMIRAN
ncbi:MAG: translation elongation factor 4 [Candidatus Pacebacteria bacterium]|nr:translation elongation factor 4 [Candidatus Paceibacterota bacterium]